MSKNPVTDPITAVREKPVDQQAEQLGQLNIGRNQILNRLWELANLNPELTRGSMAGQIKAIAMIVAIEGLIPDRRIQQHSAPPFVPPSIYVAEWRRKQQQQEEAVEPPEAAAAQKPEPSQTNKTPSPTPDPLINPELLSRVPDAANYTFDTVLNATRSHRLPMSLKKGMFPRGR